MSMTVSSTVKVMAIAAMFLLATPRPLHAVRPVVIMFYGGSLPRPVYLADTMVFHDLENPTTITAKDLGSRDHINVAMFWGPRWLPFATGERPMTSLTPSMASQHLDTG